MGMYHKWVTYTTSPAWYRQLCRRWAGLRIVYISIFLPSGGYTFVLTYTTYTNLHKTYILHKNNTQIIDTIGTFLDILCVYLKSNFKSFETMYINIYKWDLCKVPSNWLNNWVRPTYKWDSKMSHLLGKKFMRLPPI